MNKIEADKWYQLRVGEEKNQVLIQERDFKTGEVTLRIVDANKAPFKLFFVGRFLMIRKTEQLVANLPLRTRKQG